MDIQHSMAVKIAAWMIAMVLGVFPLVVFGTVYLLLLRRYAGGTF